MTSTQRPPVILLMGPTAAGKTDLAVDLVERLPCDIISVDATMVYRGMDIGSAKPDAALLARAPHRLIDIRDPADPYSAAQFRRDALQQIAAITAARRIPLLVGGTMLYYRALLDGLSPLPEADPRIRQELAEQGRRYGWPELHRRLTAIDPLSASHIHPNDPQRIQRALEVYRITGRTRTELFAENRDQLRSHRALKLVVAPADRSLLHGRIERRFGQMLQQGLVTETRALYNRSDLDLQKPAIRAVGYRQVWEYLQGNIGYQAMAQQAIVATRQLARRQLTWLRREADARWFEATATDLSDQVLFHLDGVANGL